MPDNFNGLYNLPAEVISKIKSFIMKEIYVRVESPAKIALFVYDNDTFIVESFLPIDSDVRIVVRDSVKSVKDMVSGESLSGKEITGAFGTKTGETGFSATIKAHSFRVFRINK